MLVRYYMSSPVVTVPESLSCRAALALFRERGFRRAPVERDGALVGIVSDRDVLTALPTRIGELEARTLELEREITVGQVMQERPVTTTPDTHLEDVARVMIANKLSALPVVDGHVLAGILTESDLFRALASVIGDEDGVRLTLVPPPEGRASAHNAEPAMICLRLGLELRTLLHHESPGGESLTMLRARGTRWKELAGVLVAAGYTLVELVPPSSAAA